MQCHWEGLEGGEKGWPTLCGAVEEVLWGCRGRTRRLRLWREQRGEGIGMYSRGALVTLVTPSHSRPRLDFMLHRLAARQPLRVAQIMLNAAYD